MSPSKEPCCSTSSSIEETTSEPYSRVSVKEDDVRFVACEEEAAAASGTEVENLALTIDGGELGGDGSRFQEEGHCKTLDSAEEVSSNVLDCQVLQSSSEAETKCAGVNSDSVGNCCSSHGTTATTPAAAAVAPAILKNDTRSKPSHCERTVSKCARRLKAASSPVFVESRVDAWVSEGDLHRPWSQICTEKDVERLVQAGESRTLGAGSVAAGLESIVQMHPSAPNLCPGLPPAVGAKMSSTSPTSSQNNLFSRFSSMRTPGPRPPTTSVEGVLQKFRKSFSARFYKKVKGESPPSPSSTTKAGRHASFSSYLVDDGCEPEQLPNGNGSPRTSSVSDVSVDSCEGETIFRLGPIVWRSSKERKEKCKKGKKEGEGDKSIDSTTTSVDKDDNCHNDLSFSVAKQQEEDGGEGEVKNALSEWARRRVCVCKT